MTTEQLKERLAQHAGDFEIDDGLIRHRELVDGLGNQACVLVVAFGSNEPESYNNKYSPELAGVEGMDVREAAVFSTTSDFYSIAHLPNCVHPSMYDPDLRSWMEKVLVKGETV